jgi:hypothetical protein
VLILVDDWWEHHCVKQNLVRDVRKVAKLGEQILWDGIVRAVVRCKRKTGKSVERTANAAFFFKRTKLTE